MSRYTGPKYKQCRREGINLFGNERYNLKNKNYAPGAHGPKGSFAKPSEFAKQLREKQKLKRLFGITERQMSNYYKKASSKKEITGNALLALLERRLDNVIYKSGLAKSKPHARQIVNHGLIKVNGVRVTIPSYHVQTGDKFEVIDRARKSPQFANLKEQKYAPPGWLKVDYDKLEGEMVRAIEEDELEQAVKTHLIVEYYSK